MFVNGEKVAFDDGITISNLLKKLDLETNKVVVEVDLEIISKEEYETRKLSSDSKVEIIRFVGGG